MIDPPESGAVQIVGVRYLNSRPLLAGLEAGIEAPFPYCFTTAEPARCADLLASGSASAALVPVVALPAMAGVMALPDLGIACQGAVTSVLLVSRVPLEAIRVLAYHSASRTSVLLARLLLAARWGARPVAIPADPPLTDMLSSADAAVVIGDAALRLRGRSGLTELDLGAAWMDWTSLPFVFAVWALRAAAPPTLADLLRASFEYAQHHWNELLPRWAAAHDVGATDAREYLGSTLTFRLGEEERGGMREFLARAATAGLLPAGEGP